MFTEAAGAPVNRADLSAQLYPGEGILATTYTAENGVRIDTRTGNLIQPKDGQLTNQQMAEAMNEYVDHQTEALTKRIDASTELVSKFYGERRALASEIITSDGLIVDSDGNIVTPKQGVEVITVPMMINAMEAYRKVHKKS